MNLEASDWLCQRLAYTPSIFMSVVVMVWNSTAVLCDLSNEQLWNLIPSQLLTQNCNEQLWNSIPSQHSNFAPKTLAGLLNTTHPHRLAPQHATSQTGSCHRRCQAAWGLSHRSSSSSCSSHSCHRSSCHSSSHRSCQSSSSSSSNYSLTQGGPVKCANRSCSSQSLRTRASPSVESGG